MADKTECVMELLKAGVDVNLSVAVELKEDNLSANSDSPSRCMKDVLDTYS
ncbi:hypothetical protein X975_19889, partial [Stegodyphus mimosarum]